LKAFPHLPDHWKRLQFRLQYRGKTVDFDLHSTAPALPISLPGKEKKPRLPILAAIFDLDGVLTDTSEYHFLAWKRLAEMEGLPFSRQDNDALRGVNRRESLLRLLKGRQVAEDVLQEWMERKNRFYQDLLSSLSTKDLLPGAVDVLMEIRAAGVKIGIGSASKNARTVINRLGIKTLVDEISDGYSVDRQKPAPDLFLHAARQLGANPDQCVVFEDAESGVAAALVGCMWAVGIGPQSRVGAAHVVIPSLKSITWAGLIERLKKISTLANKNRIIHGVAGYD
jgi:beta-phosphoglucomutase